MTTRSISPRFRRRSLMLTFATKKLSTGANGQKAEAEFPFKFVRAVLVELPVSWYPGSGRLPGHSLLRFIDIKLSVSRSGRLYSRPLLVQRTDQPIRASVCPGCTRCCRALCRSPGRAGKPITGVRLKGSQPSARAGGAPNARLGRARPSRAGNASPPPRAPTCGRSAPRA